MKATPTHKSYFDDSRQRWLMILRLGTNTILLIALVLLHSHGVGLNADTKLANKWFYASQVVLGLNFILALSYSYILPRLGGKSTQIAAQMLGDLLFSFSLVFLTGGSESTFSFLFLIIVINGAFLAGLRTALLAAFFAATVWALLLVFQYQGYFTPWLSAISLHSGLKDDLPVNMLASITVNTGACFLVAFLGGHLSNQLSLSKAALATSQNRLERLGTLNDSIIHSIDSGLLTVDSSGWTLSINRAGANILGLDTQLVIGRPWLEFFPELDHVSLLSKDSSDMSDSEQQKFYEGLKLNYFRPSDQAKLIIELHLLDLSDEDGKSWGQLIVLKDLTAISHMEEEVKKAEHLAAMGELAAGMAHEIRTPLAAMTGSWHMLSSHTLPPEDQERLMKIIGREMDRLGRLVSDFLAFARPPARAPQHINLAQLIEDQLKIFTHRLTSGNKASVKTSFPEKSTVFFDLGQITQVIWNLMQNAVEAGQDQDDIEISFTIEDDRVNQNYLILTIADNGKGIAQEHLRNIFEPFYTTKNSGSGLGLPIVGRIIHDGGGRIKVESTPGMGTKFIVYLPRNG